jgi:hypothetical protein
MLEEFLLIIEDLVADFVVSFPVVLTLPSMLMAETGSMLRRTTV